MLFFTKTEIPKQNIKIDYQSQLMMIGSCFAENIGHKLADQKFNLSLNPFGILYNPLSICCALERIINNKVFTEKDIFEHNELFHSYLHHGSFSSTDKQACLDNLNTSLEKAHRELIKTDLLILTFGTAYVYRLKKNGAIVSNCHKMPANIFSRELSMPNELEQQLSATIGLIRQLNPELKVICTISPIRHLKDGAHGNQISKSCLQLAIDKLCNSLPNSFYFPSYEIMLDELRDYRFYDRDMIHPSAQAVDYIWEIFRETYFSTETLSIMKEWHQIHTAVTHRPINEKSIGYKDFLRQTLLKVQTFEAKYPYICCDDELKALTDKLKKL